jgi:hypothetical protein
MLRNFEGKLKALLQSFSADVEKRNPIIGEQLKWLNTVLTKIEKSLAIEFYASLREIAKKTAESSGGLLGINILRAEESKLVILPMINELK